MLSLSRTSLAARTAALALVGATLVGCASNPSTSPATATPEVLVSERAQQRWDRLLKKDFEQAYTYLTPAYRSLKTPAQYASSFSNGAAWHSAKVDTVSCESTERCTATVKLDVLVVARGFSKPIQTILMETWLLEEDQWWFYHKD